MTACLCGVDHPPTVDNGLPRQAAAAVVTLLARLLAVHDPNFVQGNPAIIKSDTDVPGREIVVVVTLNRKGAPVMGQRPYLIRPDGR